VSVAESKTQFEIIDTNIVPDLYVTFIIDIWEGDRNDPATEVIRYIGVWRAEDLVNGDGEAHDPDWSEYDIARYSRWHRAKAKPICWEQLETVKEADSGAVMMRREYESLTDPEAYVGYSHNSLKHKELYVKFLDAIDVLAEDPDNERAWEDVNAFRQFQALKHEK